MAIVMSEENSIFRAQRLITTMSLRISRRRQLQIVAGVQGLGVLAITFVFGSILWQGVSAVGNRAAALQTSPVVPMTVGAGETMWSLANRYGNPQDSVLDRVDTLARINGLGSGSTLHPGQRLLVPVENSAEAERLQPVMASR